MTRFEQAEIPSGNSGKWAIFIIVVGVQENNCEYKKKKKKRVAATENNHACHANKS